MQDLTDRKSDWLHDRKPFKQKTKKKKIVEKFFRDLTPDPRQRDRLIIFNVLLIIFCGSKQYWLFRIPLETSLD